MFLQRTNSTLFIRRSPLHVRNIHLSVSNSKSIPSNLKGKSTASQQWLTRHLNDPFVKKARELNYRARSAFKLIEIDDRFKLLKKGMVVVECGAAPGAWTQVVVSRINSDSSDVNAPKGKVIGVDLLPITPLAGAIFLSNSDFTEPEVQELIRRELTSDIRKEATSDLEGVDAGESASKGASGSESTGATVDLILSDMAPNASGIPDFDQANLCKMVQSCLDFALKEGRPRSKFVAKIYQGSDLANLETKLKNHYKTVHRFKPKSSRDESSELYLVGLGLIK